MDGALPPTFGVGATSLAAGVLSDSSSAQKPDLRALDSAFVAAIDGSGMVMVPEWCSGVRTRE